jgi:hypothetical protein
MPLPPKSYGKFGERVCLDDEKLAKAYQLLWDYLYFRLKQRGKDKKFLRKKIYIKNVTQLSVALNSGTARPEFPLRPFYKIKLPSIAPL